jgi:hypothetical protein
MRPWALINAALCLVCMGFALSSGNWPYFWMSVSAFFGWAQRGLPVLVKPMREA